VMTVDDQRPLWATGRLARSAGSRSPQLSNCSSCRSGRAATYTEQTDPGEVRRVAGDRPRRRGAACPEPCRDDDASTARRDLVR
jgi:hypothetical protein